MYRVVTMESRLLDEEFKTVGAAMDAAAETNEDCLIWYDGITKEFYFYVIPSCGEIELVCNIAYEKRESLRDDILKMMEEWEPKLRKEVKND